MMNALYAERFRGLPHTLTIARFTLLEALRTRLPWIWAGVLAFFGAASLFINQIAITESARLQWSFYASGLRLAAVLTLAAYITSSMVRELNEKGLEMVLALDLPRAAYVAGKLLAFLGVAAAMAALAALPLALARPVDAVAAWMLSLICELAIVAAFAVFCIVSFAQVVPALLLIIAFYLLARTIDALRLMSESAVLGELGGARSLFEYAFDAIALLLPAFERFTQTEWIASGNVEAPVLLPIITQALIYTLLLLGASLIDFHRREL
ncbi:MAG: ABC transporter permease [Betaproteobacteria bacterium]|nr:ABC transporter permease [Betaproteobacteria bacterium]